MPPSAPPPGRHRMSAGRHRRTPGRHRRPDAPVLQPPASARPAVAAGLTVLATVAAGVAPATAHTTVQAKAGSAGQGSATSYTLASKGTAVLGAQLGASLDRKSVAETVAAATALTAATAGRSTAKVEPYADYEPEAGCSPEVQPGLAALRDEILRPVFGGADVDYGTLRACSDQLSGHEEGRALDWMVDFRDPAERAAGLAFLQWLLATDEDGNEHANARRLGVMYVIWNDRIWSAGQADEGWRPYTHRACAPGAVESCSPTLRHIDHIHLSLSRPGADKRTSYWTVRSKTAQGVRPATLGQFPGLTHLQRGDRNEHVLRYERRLHALGLLDAALVDGRMGRATLQASRDFQQRSGLVADGVVGPLTWAAADAAVPTPLLRQEATTPADPAE